MQSQEKGIYVSGWVGRGGRGHFARRDVGRGVLCAWFTAHGTRANNTIVTHERGGVVAGDHVLLGHFRGARGEYRVGDGWVGANS